MQNIFLGCSMIAIALASTSANAQNPSPAETAAASDAGIADIIVTASRREQSLQSTAIAVTAITSEEIKTRGVNSVTDITKLVPAVKIGQVAGSGVQVTVRGVGNFGGNSFSEPGVAFNLDGVYVARNPGASGIFYDVNRVEVLKGPQGTLYGRNSTGGVVNVITNDPTDTLGADVTAEYGNYDHKRLAGAVNLPIGEFVSVRIAGQWTKSDGVTPDFNGGENNRAGRIKFKFLPTPDLTILMEADFTRSKDGALLGGFNLPGYDPFHDITSGPTSLQNAVIPPFAPKINSDSFNDNRSRGVQGSLNYDFGPVTTTLIVANRTNTAYYRHYGAGFPVADDTRGSPSKYTTAELRIASDNSGPLKWVLGGFYFNDDLHSKLTFDQGTNFQIPDIHVKTKSYSGFMEGTYSVTPAVRLTAGGRYTSDDKAISGYGIGPYQAPPQAVAFVCPASLGAVYNPTPIVSPVGAVFPGGSCTSPISGQETFKKFTWKLGAEADVGDHSLLYATVATGFKAGGFFASLNTAAAGATPNNSYRPETMTAYTIGSKNRFFGNTLQINAEVFYWDYKNKQVSHLGPVQPGVGFNLIVENAGGAEIYGSEIEALWKPSRNDTFSADIQYLHTKYTALQYKVLFAGPAPFTACPIVGAVTPGAPFKSAIVSCAGRPVSFSPEWTLNLGYRHNFDLGDNGGVSAGVNTQIQTKFWQGEEYLPDQLQKSSMVTDADLTWKAANGRYSISAYVQNLENEQIGGSSFVYPFTGGVRRALRPPRTYGARLNVTF